MKKILILMFFLSVISTGQSQVLISLLLGDKLNSEDLEFGITGGLNWASISGFESKDPALLWNLGFYFNIRIKNNWHVYTGVLVKSNLGLDNLTENDLNMLGATRYYDLNGIKLQGSYFQKSNTFLVPAFIKYAFKSNFYIATGPHFGLTKRSWIEYRSDIEGKQTVIKEYNTKEINRIDVGPGVGFGWSSPRPNGTTFGIIYYYGLVNYFKNIPRTKNSSFFIEACIPIGAGKKKSQQK